MDYLVGEQLWQRVISVTSSALECGALQSIPTSSLNRTETLHGVNLPFQIRVVANLTRKSEEMKQRTAQTPAAVDFNPFLPYDPNLYVGELTDHYRCLLNKFNVMEHHVLMVTSSFITQLEPLNIEDFLAAQICLEARDGLVFYNGGAAAGASITHKHLQMVPLPFSPGISYPFQQLWAGLPLQPGVPAQSALPFAHRVSATTFGGNSHSCAEANWRCYQTMMEQLELLPGSDGLAPPHNLLMTKEHLWVVPRRCERLGGLAVNALGFAGTLLVKNDQQLQELEQLGCLPLLQAVAVPRDCPN